MKDIVKITNLVIEDRINDKFTSRVYQGENADKLLDIIRDDVYSKLGQSLEDLNAEITNTSVYITVGDQAHATEVACLHL